MGTLRRQYTDEFKREAVGLLASSGRPLSQIAQELGIAPSRLRAWRNRDEGVQAGSPRRPMIWPLKTPVCGARMSVCIWSGRF
jgi:transposase-like protein